MTSLPTTIVEKPFGRLRYYDGKYYQEYYATIEEARAASTEEDLEAARAAAGGWADMDYDEMVEALDRSRHEMPPSPPLGKV